jgi:hypothetical protein
MLCRRVVVANGKYDDIILSNQRRFDKIVEKLRLAAREISGVASETCASSLQASANGLTERRATVRPRSVRRSAALSHPSAEGTS